MPTGVFNRNNISSYYNGEFSFIPIICPICKEQLELKKSLIRQYNSGGFPKKHKRCINVGRTLSEEHKDKIRKSCKNTPNRGLFKKGNIPWNSSKLKQPEITPEIKQVLLTEQEKLQIALKRLKENVDKRLNAPKPGRPKKEENIIEEKVSNINPDKKMIKCIKTEKIRPQCTLRDCEHYNFCHTFRHVKIKKSIKNYRNITEILGKEVSTTDSDE